MLTTPDDLALALAQEYVGVDIPEPDATTLGVGLRIARALEGLSAPDGRRSGELLAALGEAPRPATLERHARSALLDAHLAAREVAARTGGARREALARAAQALRRFGTWCLFAGYPVFGASVHEVAVGIWPPGLAVEERLWATFEADRRTAFGRAGAQRPASVAAMVDAFRAQLRAAERPEFMPLLRYMRAVHELHCGRWAAAEGLARGVVRAGARQGNARMEALGYEILVPVLGRQDRHAEAAAVSLAAVAQNGAPSAAVGQALLNVGVAMQGMRLFDAALEAFAAAERWERQVDERPFRLLRSRILRQELELHALRGDRGRFIDAHRRLALGTLPIPDRIFVHRDAASGFMRFGDVARAMEELRKAQVLSETHGYHYDWFTIEQEIQRLKHVHSPARDVAELERAEVELVQNARAAWETLGRRGRAIADTR